ncbi:hypothetical protein CSOJ01_05615 [Colletotrichum sojae]|uniref:Transmembrane protein n=1 Tax=Colletotrichum sojae TaxID=2175907 RepID=A0A8H6JFC1_9PEZI|nr:hypothetical protein CSOJ01_05615 [Colletotrichum sojae]
MYQPLENDTAGPTARDEQDKPGKESPATSITEIDIPGEPQAERTRLGLLIRLGIVLSLTSLVVAFAFISWLWWAPREDPRWRRWVLVRNRLQLSVNVASLVIRTAIGTLAAAAATMIASVAVERYGVRLHAVAQVSITRFASNGPVSLAALALQDSIASFYLRTALLCLELTTVASQFTSTLLVADLEQSHIISFPRQASGACTREAASLPRNSKSHQFPQHMREAQCVDLKIKYMSAYGDPKVSIHGAFRIDDPTARVALGVDPTAGYREFICTLSLEPWTEQYVWQICTIGDVDWKNVRDPLSNRTAFATILLDTDNLLIPFKMAPMEFRTNMNEYFGFVVADLEGLTFKLATYNFTQPGPWTQVMLDTKAYLDGMEQIARRSFSVMLNNTLTPEGFEETEIQEIKIGMEAGHFDDVERLLRQRMSNKSTTNWMTRRKGPLQQLNRGFSEMKRRTEDEISLRMSLCIGFSSGGFDYYSTYGHLNHLEIFASSTKPRTEPTYVLTSDREAYDTSAVRRQLGAVSGPTKAENRSILFISPDQLSSSLAGVRNNASYGRAFYNETDVALAYWARQSTRSSPQSLSFRQAASGYGFQDDPALSHELYSELLHATINDTNSPASALQAVYFSKSRQVYQDFIELMPPRDDCNYTITTFESAMVSGRRAGYWAVLGILVAFAICFLVVRILFDSTKCSLPDNAWHTIAQVSESAEISAVLSRSKMKTDKEVAEISKHLKDDDEEDRFVVRGGVFARVSTGSTADDSEIGPAGTTTTGSRRRLMARLRAPRDGTILLYWGGDVCDGRTRLGQVGWWRLEDLWGRLARQPGAPGGARAPTFDVWTQIEPVLHQWKYSTSIPAGKNVRRLVGSRADDDWTPSSNRLTSIGVVQKGSSFAGQGDRYVTTSPSNNCCHGCSVEDSEVHT